MSDRWAPLQKLLEAGVSQGVFTAAVALVGLQGELRWQGAAGRVSRDPDAAAVTPDTIFDLASLTKPLATTLALMVLAGRGRLDPAASLGEVLPAPWLPPDKQPLTLTSLLTHRSGLPAWRPFYQEVLAAPTSARPTLLERLAAATPLEYPPDTATLYSDLGFMLLKAVVEGVSGETLDQFCREEIYRPLGLETWASSPCRTGPGTGDRKPKTAFMPPPNRASSRDVPRPARCTTKTPGPRAGWRATPASSAPAGRSFGWWPACIGLMVESPSGRSPRPRSGAFSRSPPAPTGPWASTPPARTRPTGRRAVFFPPERRPPGLHRHLFLAGPGLRPDGSLTDEPGPPGPGRQDQNPGLPAPVPRGGVPGFGV